MRPETSLILQLLGELIGTAGGEVVVNTTEGKVPAKIAKRIERFSSKGFSSPMWTHADYDLQVLIAVLDIMWEERIQPLVGKDEVGLQLMFGTSATLGPASASALMTMQRQQSHMLTLKKQCEAMPAVAQLIAKKSWLGGPANVSQVTFDQTGADEVRRLCDRNKREIDVILQKLTRIIPMAQRLHELHVGRR
jgi:hypothetical protein